MTFITPDIDHAAGVIGPTLAIPSAATAKARTRSRARNSMTIVTMKVMTTLIDIAARG